MTSVFTYISLSELPLLAHRNWITARSVAQLFLELQTTAKVIDSLEYTYLLTSGQGVYHIMLLTKHNKLEYGNFII